MSYQPFHFGALVSVEDVVGRPLYVSVSEVDSTQSLPVRLLPPGTNEGDLLARCLDIHRTDNATLARIRPTKRAGFSEKLLELYEGAHGLYRR